MLKVPAADALVAATSEAPNASADTAASRPMVQRWLGSAYAGGGSTTAPASGSRGLVQGHHVQADQIRDHGQRAVDQLEVP